MRAGLVHAGQVRARQGGQVHAIQIVSTTAVIQPKLLPTIEWLLSELESLATRYKNDKMTHFQLGVQLGWEKLDEYYKLTDKSPVYLAALCLYPKYKWKFIHNKWSHKKWIKNGEAAVEKLWSKYKVMKQKQPCKKSRLTEFMDEDLSDSDDDEEKDEYIKWKNGRREKNVTNPIAY